MPVMAEPPNTYATPRNSRAARAAFKAYDQTPLETRRRILAAAREALSSQYATLATLAVEESGLGRVEDKIQKNRLVTERTPGTEDLEPVSPRHFNVSDNKVVEIAPDPFDSFLPACGMKIRWRRGLHLPFPPPARRKKVFSSHFLVLRREIY